MGSNLLKNLTGFVSEMKTLSDEKLLLEKIENGFKNREFKMYLQFIVHNKTKRIKSFEALSRWESSDGTIIQPMEYIGIMEKYGLITKLDYYMFEKVCEKLSKWKDTDFGEFTISCNFTRITISDRNFVENIRTIAEKYDFDRSKLVMEITEDSAERNMRIAIDNVSKVKEFGFRIALDDIGKGYTTLISLCEYPVDVVKIERDILLLAEEERGRSLLWGIVSLARNLSLEVVCEGVETEVQNALISSSGCDYIQGWYYSKALPEIVAEESAKEYMLSFQ